MVKKLAKNAVMVVRLDCIKLMAEIGGFEPLGWLAKK
jgi:hypothetical protein